MPRRTKPIAAAAGPGKPCHGKSSRSDLIRLFDDVCWFTEQRVGELEVEVRDRLRNRAATAQHVVETVGSKPYLFSDTVEAQPAINNQRSRSVVNESHGRERTSPG